MTDTDDLAEITALVERIRGSGSFTIGKQWAARLARVVAEVERLQAIVAEIAESRDIEFMRDTARGAIGGVPEDVSTSVDAPSAKVHRRPSIRWVAEGWWHPNVRSGQVHDHPTQPGRSWSEASHRLCEPVYTARPAPAPTEGP